MLKGSLDDFSLEDIFWLVERAHNTGELKVTRPSGMGSFYFRDGHIYWAESNLLRESLSSQLVRAGIVTQIQLKDAEARGVAGERLGEGLASLGVVTGEELTAAYRDRIGDVTFELLRQNLGEFDWEGQSKAEPDFSFSLSVEEVMRVASERFAELERIKQDIPSEMSVLAISSGTPDEVSAITVSAEQWKMLALVNGGNTVADIGRSADLNDLSVLRLLHGMVARGLLEVLPEAEPQVSASEIAAAEADPTIGESDQSISLVDNSANGAELDPGSFSVSGPNTTSL